MVQERPKRGRGNGTGGRGWPGKRALIAALALHLVVGLLLIEWWRPAAEPERRAVSVALLATEKLPSKEALDMPALPAPRPSAVALPTPEPAPPPPEPPHDEKTTASPPPRLDEAKPPIPPTVKPIAPSPRKKAPETAEQPKRVVRTGPPEATPLAALMPGVAVYDVVVDAHGQIRSVTLAHSSGTTSFDASGEAMIRNGIGFQPPADAGPEPQVFTVTIAFTPEGR